MLNSPVTKFEKEKEWENDMKKMLRIICWGRKLLIESINHYLMGTENLKRAEIIPFFNLNTILNTLKSMLTFM